MPPKKEVKPVLKGFKQGIPAKDLIPSDVKNLPREFKPIKLPNEFSVSHPKPLFESFPEPEEWPGDEIAANFDFGIESEKVFKENSLPSLPSSFSADSKMILWRRPIDFIKDLQKETMSPLSKNLDRKYGRRSTSLLKPMDDNDFEESKPSVSQRTIIKVFDTFERDEEEWETEQRIKEMQAALDKSKKKAPKVIEEDVPIKIKVPFLSDIDMSNKDSSSNFSRWIASVLQMIKDRNIKDIYTEKPIWTKIYPQVKGIPVFNNSGRYWVKLYFMGKERKIEIDDRFPVNVESKSLFPVSEKFDEIWPLIFSKALLKLASHVAEAKSSDIETGQGLFMNALTGLIPQTIKIDDDFNEKLKYISSLLNDFHYLKNTCFLTCYCLPGHKPIVPLASASNEKKGKVELQNIPKFTAPSNSNAMKLSRRNSMYSADVEKVPVIKPHEKSSNIIPGFLYSMMELFANDNFNMVYVLKRSDDEIKLRQDYYNLSKQTMHKMSKEEKLEHRKQKKELREKITEEEKKRIELITKPPIQYKLFKIGSNVLGSQLNKFSLPFTENEIYLAKKCIVNKLARPPNYDMPEIKGDDKSMYSQAQSQAVSSGFEIKPLEEFNIPNCKEPLKREENGNWLTDKDFKNCFNFVQIYFNPKKLNFNSVFNIKSSPENYLTIDNEHQILKFSKAEQESNPNSTSLIGFFPQEAKVGEINPSPFLVLEKINVRNLKNEFLVTLTNKMDSFLHNYDDQIEHFFKVSVFSPLSYTLWVSSDTSLSAMSFYDFLKKELAFNSNSFNIDHIPIEKCVEYIFGKFSISTDNDSNVFLKINHPDKNTFGNFKIRILEIPPESVSAMLDSIEGVEKNLYENELFVQHINKLKIIAGKRYILTIEGKFPFNLNENSMSIEILNNSDECNLQIYQLEMCEPMEIVESYKGNKYGKIFKEHIYLKNEAQCSIYLKFENFFEGSEENKIPLKLELIENDNVLYWSTGNSKAILGNIPLKPNKSYFLQSSINQRNLGKKPLSSIPEINWILTIFSTESLAIVKDTEKEDREAEIMKSWETSQPGRAEKAKIARKKFLAKQKLMRGEILTEEETSLAKAPRVLAQDKKEEDKGAKKAAPVKGKAPPVKGNVPLVEEKQEPTANIVFPHSSECNMTEMKEFIQKLEGSRFKVHHPEHQGLVTVRNERELQEMFEQANMSEDEIISFTRERLSQLRIDALQDIENKRMTFKNEIEKIKEDFVGPRNAILTAKNEIKKQIYARKDVENNLVNLLSADNPNVEEINKILNEHEFNEIFHKAANKVLLKAKFDEITRKIQTSLDNFEIEILNEMVSLVEEKNYDIDVDLYDKATEMIEEARINPNFVAEKLAETKKAGKKPGKK